MAGSLLSGAGMSRNMLVVCSLIVSCVVARAAFADPMPPPIIGGTVVPQGKWPDTVAVLMRGGACSGTLVAPDVVVTAGHCIDSEPYEVVLDSVDYSGRGGERIAVAWSRAYPEWYRKYDVGVVVLSRPSKVAPRAVTSACTVRDELVAQRQVKLVGFGVTREDAEEANTLLHETTVAVTDPTCTLDPACQEAIAPHGEFIAGGRGKDSCFGDSGGPVMLELASGPALVGIVSRGLSLAATPCGGGGVYVRADKVTSWIQSVTGRKLVRTSCDGKSEVADDLDAESMTDGGCHTGEPLALGLAIVVGGFVLGRRRC